MSTVPADATRAPARLPFPAHVRRVYRESWTSLLGVVAVELVLLPILFAQIAIWLVGRAPVESQSLIYRSELMNQLLLILSALVVIPVASWITELPPRRLRWIPVLILLGLLLQFLFGAAHYGLCHALGALFGGDWNFLDSLYGVSKRGSDPGFFGLMRLYFGPNFYGVFSDYVFNLLVFSLFEVYRTRRGRELRESQLEAGLAKARLEGLTQQLQPHFLFNALHSLSELIHADPEAADRMLTRLSDLLRQVLEGGGTHVVPLSRELRLVEAYLDIEKVRFGARLQVHLDAGSEVQGFPVPAFSLQPLVENAIKHGLSRMARPGRLDLMARREGDHLEVVIRNPVPAHGVPSLARSGGLGLRNLDLRLRVLYGSDYTLASGPAGPEGWEARLRVPAAGLDVGSSEGEVTA